MPVSPGFREHVVELLAPLGEIKVKRFFSGIGLYLSEKLIGFVIADRIYLRTDDRFRADFAKEGAKPFTFTKHSTGEVVSIGYYEVPAHIFEDQDAMVSWSRLAYDAALAKTAKKPAKRKRGEALPADLPLVAPTTVKATKAKAKPASKPKATAKLTAKVKKKR